MAIQMFKLPDPGEGLLEAEIVEWKVAVGDTVKINDIVVEVETAKSLVELPIPWAGTVTELYANVGDEVEVGNPLIAIDDGLGGSGSAGGDSDTGANAVSPGPDAAPAPVVADAQDAGAEGDGEEPVKTLVGYGPKASSTSRRLRKRPAPAPPAAAWQEASGQPVAQPAVAPVPTSEVGDGDRIRVLAKPPVRKLAKDLGVDLGTVMATGEGGIVTSGDVKRAAAEADEAAVPAPAAQRAPGERETRTPIKGVRKMTAQAMVASAFTAPHVTEWVTVDVSAAMELVDRLKRERAFADVKVTPLLILAKAMCLAVQRNPGVNASWDEAAQEIVTKHYVNLGIAAATPRGLVVPNIKDADAMTLHDLAVAMGALTATAREGRTSPADMAGGTITITNVGVFGVDAGTPIINPGESAILAFGTIARRPWVVGEGADERIEPRWVTTLALSFDHRLVDGELGSKYLADVAALLNDPTKAFVWA